MDTGQFLGTLVVIFVTAKAFGYAARRLGQPAVLGELVGGLVIGKSLLRAVNPDDASIHHLAELGVAILLFAIGLETDLSKLLRVGAASAAVAFVGVILPFGLGYGLYRAVGLPELTSVVAGASLTATSVGITARVLSDLGHLAAPEGQIVLGAAIIDDVLGLIILTVVDGLANGDALTVAGVVRATAVAFGFLAVTVALGRFAVPPLLRASKRIDLPGTQTMLAVILCLGLAWLAGVVGSASVIGAFAAGLLLAGSDVSREVEKGVESIGHFFVPIFFVSVGASVDLRQLDGRAWLIGAGLTAVGVAGKFAAGYAPVWDRSNKAVIGVGMVPRGEVGLIFAHRGLATKAFDVGMYGAVTLMVLVTTMIVPPALKVLLKAAPPVVPHDPEGIEDLVTEA